MGKTIRKNDDQKSASAKEVPAIQKPKKMTKAEKHLQSKLAGNVPDYTPKKLVIATELIPFLTADQAEAAKIIWEGSNVGLVRLHDMTFRIKRLTVHGGDTITVVYVHEAKKGTELEGLTGNETFVSLGMLHLPMFRSKLTRQKELDVQLRMYNFLRHVFQEEGLLPTPTKHVHVVAAESFKTSPASRLMSCKNGFYDFSKDADKLIVKLFKGKEEYEIEIVQISGEHPLKKNNIDVGFAIPSAKFYNKRSFDNDEKTTALIAYLREIVDSQKAQQFPQEAPSEAVVEKVTPPTEVTAVATDNGEKPVRIGKRSQFGIRHPYTGRNHSQKQCEETKTLH